jgi:transcriptional regulator with XRE-family HTH domain
MFIKLNTEGHMEIGLLIKQYRQKNNLTLREFAKSCGTSHSYISMLESGKNSKTGEPMVPTLTMLNKISQAMNISVNDLINLCDDIPISLSQEENTPEEPKLTEGERMLLDLFRQIPEEQQKVFLDMGRVYANSLKKD